MGQSASHIEQHYDASGDSHLIRGLWREETACHLAYLSSGGVISGIPTKPWNICLYSQCNRWSIKAVSKNLSIAIYPSGSSTSSSSSSSSSSSTTSTSTSSKQQQGIPPSCTLSTSPELSNPECKHTELEHHKWPTSGLYSPSSGTCSSFANSTGGSCATAHSHPEPPLDLP